MQRYIDYDNKKINQVSFLKDRIPKIETRKILNSKLVGKVPAKTKLNSVSMTIEYLYVVENFSSSEIARIFRASNSLVIWHLRRLGVPIRGRGGANRAKKEKELYLEILKTLKNS